MFEPSREDARLLQRALKQGWDVPVALRSKIIEVLGGIVGDEVAKARERTAAARAVMSAARLELDAIRVAQGAQYEDLVARMGALEGKTDAGLARTQNGDGSAGASLGGPGA
jgi:hypothetical protein